MTDFTQKIRLIEIRVDESPFTRQSRCWVVTLGYFPSDQSPVATWTATWYFDRLMDAADVVPVARHAFHMMAKDMAEGTAEWQLPPEVIEAKMKR